MKTTTFDAVARNLGSALTRREAVRGLVASAVAVVAGGAVLEAEAKRKGRRKKGKKGQGNTQGGGQQLLQPGEFCQFSSQCTPSYICEVPVNAGNSDRTCCGAQGAVCGPENEDGDESAPFCCVGHDCVFNGSIWTCQAVLDEI